MKDEEFDKEIYRSIAINFVNKAEIFKKQLDRAEKRLKRGGNPFVTGVITKLQKDFKKVIDIIGDE